MSPAKIVLTVSLLVSSVAVVPARAERIVTTSEGSCIEGPHETVRIRRLPGAPATSHRPRNPSEDHFIHCSEASADDGPASTQSVPRTRR